MPKALISIAGIDIPTPSKYVGITADVVDAGRNVQGFFVGALVREDMAKVEASWNYLTAQQWSAILKMFNSKYGGAFLQSVTFFNQTTADWETRKMYPGDRTTSGAHKRDPVTGAIIGWEKPVLHLIEQ